MPHLTTILVATIALAVLGGALLFACVPSARFSAAMEAEVRERLENGEVRLVDVRTEAEFDRNALEGAINLPVQALADRHAELGEKDAPIVLYCRSGNRSAEAKHILESAGYRVVYDLGSRGNAARVLGAP